MFVNTQAATVPALPVHQPGVFSREPCVRPAGEDVLCRNPHRRASEGRDQRHAFCPVRHLALCVSLQDRKDVTGQHLPGIQGERPIPSLVAALMIALMKRCDCYVISYCSSFHTLQGMSVCQVTVIGALVILLYTSRACYNLVVLGLSNKRINSFDYDWYNVSDQVSHRRATP